MELSFGEFSRENILQSLQERHINLPDADRLDFEELLRIYKTFMLPLAKRERKSKLSRCKAFLQNEHTANFKQNNIKHILRNSFVEMDIDEEEKTSEAHGSVSRSISSTTSKPNKSHSLELHRTQGWWSDKDYNALEAFNKAIQEIPNKLCHRYSNSNEPFNSCRKRQIPNDEVNLNMNEYLSTVTKRIRIINT
ncbi:uncharacterized protein LOC119671857 [Teleopsis dalmanni]|uniref:uncharacterized protein LOC119671857 n=1 Tax=Teleopsis dalmanni TaxID=139649 RepID=UPI0018CDC733|nr:uncharacterized protein LOC119671857 [Teleopsis dalmanni]